MNTINTAKAFGCHDVISFVEEPTPRHLNYLDLLRSYENGGLKVDAVAEFQARPLLYIVSKGKTQQISKEEIIELQHLLANRGESAYLGILSPGELNVYPINLSRSILEQGYKTTIKQDNPEAQLFFQSIMSGMFTLAGQPDEPDYVFKIIHELLSLSSKTLINTYGLNPLDVLSFLGRALFFRFLCDRKIIQPNEFDTICPQATSPDDCFVNVHNSVATCRWLDETFNGDLLPFTSSRTQVFEDANIRTKGKIFNHLRAIIGKWKHAGNDHFQLRINWGDLDFAHIPIGVLSQVYESFSRAWDAQLSENTSVYYTPKNIARYLVDDAFEGVTNKIAAQILDPSCGAGIFLVLAFRKLVAARWEKDRKRPDTGTIQSILYKQLCGFDVSESALRLAALSLYITAIELNGSPRPPRSLMFPRPLQGVVLYNHRRPEERDSKGFILGSLHPDISNEFNNRFDLVIGNPPWSRLKGENEDDKKKNKSHNAVFSGLTRQILIDRGFRELAKTYKNPDNNPDLPFLWRSTQWAKQYGIIAMALPGRIFLKQTPSGTRAFNALLQGIEITGILNGSNLSDTEVWSGMNQPFMLFFARNHVPVTNHSFHFVTPHFEKQLNEKGLIRIDYQSAQPIVTSAVTENPWLLKTLAVGTALDVEILHKLNELDWPTVGTLWTPPHFYSGLGYNLSPKSRQSKAVFIYKIPDFSPPPNSDFSVDVQLLPNKFEHLTAHMPRCIELYTPPLLIVPESPGGDLFSPKSWIIRSPIVFSKSYYGFSAYGCESSDLNIALLHLITHSELFRYNVLMTSSRMGAERRTFLKENLDKFPFPTHNCLSKNQKLNIINLSKQLETAANKPWREINDFIFDLYGLDKYERQVVQDTLEVAPPFKEARDRANSIPTKQERDAFYSEVQRMLAPSFAVTDETVSVDEIAITKSTTSPPWHSFSISASSGPTKLTQLAQKRLISLISAEANKKGCSRAIVNENRALIIGVIGQYRYWTLSRARLLAIDILRHHLDTFPLRKN